MSCENGVTRYKTKRNLVFTCPSVNLIRNGMIEFFNFEDAKKIVDSSCLKGGSLMTRIAGSSLYVPNSRVSLLPFFVICFAMALAFAIPIGPRHMHIGPFIEPGGVLIFPFSFIFTDLVNELYGYAMAKRMIRFCAAVLIAIGAIMQFSFTLTSASYLSQDVVNSYYTVFNDIPRHLYINAIGLLIADHLNAYLFSRIKVLLNGSALWFRSLLSTLFGQFTYTIVWVGGVFFEKLFVLDTYRFMIENFTFKLIFATCALPFIYALVYFVKYREEANYKEPQLA